MCNNHLSYERKKNRNRATTQFRFFVANVKKEK
mgnify:CR=1 FL=1